MADRLLGTPLILVAAGQEVSENLPTSVTGRNKNLKKNISSAQFHAKQNIWLEGRSNTFVYSSYGQLTYIELQVTLDHRAECVQVTAHPPPHITYTHLYTLHGCHNTAIPHTPLIPHRYVTNTIKFTCNPLAAHHCPLRKRKPRQGKPRPGRSYRGHIGKGHSESDVMCAPVCVNSVRHVG